MNKIDFYLTYDHPARRRVMCASIGVGASVGALAEILKFPHPAPIIACVVASGLAEIIGALTQVEPNWKVRKALTESPVRRRLVYSALSAAVLLMISKLRIPETEVLASERKLQRVSDNPTDPQNINEARRVLAGATAAHIKIPPSTLEKTGAKFVEASKKNPAAWDAALAFVNFKTSLNNSSTSIPTHSVPGLIFTRYPMPPPFQGMPIPQLSVSGMVPITEAAKYMPIGEDLNQEGSVGNEFIFATGGAQIIDGWEFKNVIFINVQIVYKGGSVRITNVYFLNCVFDMQAVQNAQNLALATLVPSPATNFSGN